MNKFSYQPDLIEKAESFKNAWRSSDDIFEVECARLINNNEISDAFIIFAKRFIDIREIQEMFPFLEDECQQAIAQHTDFIWEKVKEYLEKDESND